MFLLFDSPEGGPALDSDAILESSGGSFQAGLTFYLMGMGQLYERTMQHRKAKAIEALRDQINLWNEPHDLEFLRMLSDLTAPHANPRPPFRDFAAVKEHRARMAVYATVRRDIPQLWRIFHPEVEVQL